MRKTTLWSDEGSSPVSRDRGRTGSVQSLERAFVLLENMAAAGGVRSLSELATDSNLPLSSIHRVVRTLVDLGYVRQEPSRQYALGPRLIRLGEISARMISVWARPHLTTLVNQTGESANLAMLDGTDIIYIGQVPSKHSVRMFTEVGRRVLPHCTAVGKAILAQLPIDEVRTILSRTGMPRSTAATITDPDVLIRQLGEIAKRGYAIDEGEQEDGVRCVAVAVPNAPTRLAMSVSGPAGRMSEEVIDRAVPVLTRACAGLSADLQ